MIYPKLDKVRDGGKMSVELVNGLIKRTEYAADLLKQYKCVAGTGINIKQRYDGATIGSTGAYRIVGTATVSGAVRGWLYDGLSFTDIIYPGAVSTTPQGIYGSTVVGYAVVGSFERGWIYNGSSFTDIIDDRALRTFATDIYQTIVVGFSQRSDIGGRTGWSYNGASFSDIIYPGAFLTAVYGYDGINIVGDASSKGFVYNGSTFSDIIYPGSATSSARGIDGINIVGFSTTPNSAWIYKDSSFTQISKSAQNLQAHGIKGSKIVGVYGTGSLLPSATNNGYLYENETFTDIIYPNATSTIAYAIG
jgi:hypothetical protein